MPAEYTDNTGAVGDSDDDDKMNSTVNLQNQHSGMRQSSSRDNLLRSKHGVNDESASYGALNTKREKKITVSEVDSSLRGGRHEHSISDMSVQMK